MIFEIGIVLSAFTLQLLALPGEKGQLIISALATKYRPIPVAVGSSSAFALWTVVEIWLGNELKGYLPEDILDWAMSVLLIIFALLILYDSTTETTVADKFEDNKYFVYVSDHIPNRIEGGVMAFLVICFGEFGDKTQIITIGLAAKYGAIPEIWIGEMLAIVPITLINALAVSRFSEYYAGKKLNYVAATLLLLFAVDIILNLLIGESILPI